MKSKRILLGVLAAALILPTLQSCKKGENDPGISFRSRKGRLSGDWTVKSISFTQDGTDESMNKNTYTGGSNQNDDESTSSMTYSFDGATEVITMSGTGSNTSTSTWTGGTSTSTNSDTYEMTMDGAAGTWESTNTDTDASGTDTDKSNGDYTNATSITYSFVKDGTFTMTKTTSETRNVTGGSYNGVAYVLPSGFKQEETREVTETVTGTWSFVGKNKSEEMKKGERVALWYKSKETTTDETTLSNDGCGATCFDETSVSSETISDTYSDNVPDEVWTLDMLKNKEISAMMDMSSTNDYTRTYEGKYNGVSTGVNDQTGSTTSTGSGSITLSQE